MRAERIEGAVAEAALARALVASARERGLAARIVAHASHPWASATFVGARHALTLAFARAPGWGAWIAALPEAELAPRGHLVADLVVERIEDDGTVVRLTLAVLTIEDR